MLDAWSYVAKSTSIPSLSRIEVSNLVMAAFIALGGGSLVRPMQMAFERFVSSTTVSFLLSSFFCKTLKGQINEFN